MRLRTILPFFLTLLAFGGLVSSALASSAPPANWWNKSWAIRKPITIDTSVADAAVTEPIGTAVVLLRLHDGSFQFAAGKEDGSDIRVLADDHKTLLPYHIERFDSLLNEGFVWVKIPDLKPGAKTTIWLYSGNTGESAAPAQDAKGTYDAETMMVFHFSEANSPANDITGKGNVSEAAGSPVTGSMIAGGLRFTGRNPLTIPTTETNHWLAGAPLTWSAWVKPTALAANAIVFSRREGNSSFVIGMDNGTPFVEIDGQRAAAAKPVEENTWHHLAVVVESGKATLYVDGEAASPLSSSVPALQSPLFIGGASADGATGFVGEVDELQIAKTARPFGWIKFAALSQGNGDRTGKVISFGADEQGEGGGGGEDHSGYFKVIVDSLTLDGWIVIGILAVMLVISWWVMWSKMAYLNGISKGNKLFMKEWEHVVNDLTVLDHGSDQEKTKSLGGRVNKKGQKRMRQSSVYRLYHIGVEEIRHRMAADRNGKVLSARSIQSIRSTMDGTLVREKQKIDSLIVLLTICISGGPFLGLLGTVVGVMITFAAVAAAGDVNVNAIAPGIAAALLATVAGLAVAIPALFGYNYILARVKDATADMHVFIDEFVTRMAEFYSEPTVQPEARPAFHPNNKQTDLPELAATTT